MLIRGYTLMNDLFMRSVLKDTDCTAYILQVILGQKDLRVVEQIIQKDYVNLYGRSLRLDCVVKDAAGRLFNVEVQRASRGAVPRRARYHSSLLDLDVVIWETVLPSCRIRMLFLLPRAMCSKELKCFTI